MVNKHALHITITKSGEFHFQSNFHWCFIIDFLSQHKSQLCNLISRKKLENMNNEPNNTHVGLTLITFTLQVWRPCCSFALVSYNNKGSWQATGTRRSRHVAGAYISGACKALWEHVGQTKGGTWRQAWPFLNGPDLINYSNLVPFISPHPGPTSTGAKCYQLNINRTH